MRILVHVSVSTMLRHFTDVIRTLADRGHDVRITWSEESTVALPADLAGCERIALVASPAGRSDHWAEKLEQHRALGDYLRYFEPAFARAAKLRSRARRKAFKALTGGEHKSLAAHCPRCTAEISDDDLVRMLLDVYPGAGAAVARRLALVEDTVPSDPAIDAFLRAEQPDVLLVTPLIKTPLIKNRSPQPDYVKSATALGIPVAFPVFSWDNLSTKGLIHVMPDQVFVWNDRQRTEAIELHHVPADRVVVTGAPRFDQFFLMQPQLTRDEFCAAHGFDPGQPILTYLCSSEFVADREREFVVRWIDEVRQHPALTAGNILIRPHPRQRRQWKHFRFHAPPRVTVAYPQSISADETLFEAVHHSVAVVGLNTSAQLEAGIVGRPVFTILATEFAGGQQETLHFEYLLKEHGGFVDVAPDFETHRRQLGAVLAGGADTARIREFIDLFLRPHGRDLPVAPIMARAIEELASRGRTSRRSSWSWFARAASWAMAARPH